MSTYNVHFYDSETDEFMKVTVQAEGIIPAIRAAQNELTRTSHSLKWMSWEIWKVEKLYLAR